MCNLFEKICLTKLVKFCKVYFLTHKNGGEMKERKPSRETTEYFHTSFPYLVHFMFCSFRHSCEDPSPYTSIITNDSSYSIPFPDNKDVQFNSSCRKTFIFLYSVHALLILLGKLYIFFLYICHSNIKDVFSLYIYIFFFLLLFFNLTNFHDNLWQTIKEGRKSSYTYLEE